MPNNEQLDETNDSLTPLGNPFGIPQELLTEIVQDAMRVSKVKSIQKNDLEKYLVNGENWRVKVLIAGSISNMVIRNDIEGEHCLQTLNSFPEEHVIKELVKLLISYMSLQKTTISQRKAKKSSTRIHANPNINARKDSRGGKAVEPSHAGDNNMILIISGVLVLAFVVSGIVLFNKSNPYPIEETTPNTTNVAVVSEPEKTPIEENQPEKTPPVEVAPIKKEVVVEAEPFKMLEIKDDLLTLQIGRDEFYKGDVYSLEGNRKVNSSPFSVSGNQTKSISRVFFDLRHIPENVDIESARLMINVSYDNDEERELLIYCYPSSEKMAYDYLDLIDRKKGAIQNEISLRNEWATFDVTKSTQDWINSGINNNGYWFFTDKKVRFLFSGFETQRAMLSPRLLITLSEKKKKVIETEAKNNIPETKIDPPKTVEVDTEVNLPEEKIEVVATATTQKEKASEDDVEDVKDGVQLLLDQVRKDDPIDDDTKKEENKEVAKNDISEPLMPEAPKSKTIEEKTLKEEKKKEGVESKLGQKAVDTGVMANGPSIEVASRLLGQTEKIRIKNDLGYGQIRYTFDGQEPSADSALLTGEELEPNLALNRANGKLKLAVFQDGKRVSHISEMTLRVFQAVNVIDNTNNARCKRTGKWDLGRNDKKQYGRDYLFAYRTGKKANSVVWQPLIRSKSKFEVYVWLPDGDFTRADNATYIVHSEEGEKTIEISQREEGQSWIYLGEFTFSKSNSHNLELIDDKEGKVIIADAAYFHPVEGGE